MLLDAPSRIQKPSFAGLNMLIEHLMDTIESDGPLPENYASLNRLIRRLGDDVRAGLIASEAVQGAIQEITERHFAGTLQAQARAKHHGYSGDFEMIDAIYTLRMSGEPRLRAWDSFFHSQAAPCAVRNRKALFHQLLAGIPPATDGGRSRVLNVGCGPARDLREWFLSGPPIQVFFDCVEMDARAIRYASNLCRPFLQHIEFYHENALRYVPSSGYDLVWSAGLFDYVNDKVFVRLLKALLPVVKPGGNLVVGNFSDFNPSRDFMEIFGNWQLVHRSREQLISLAERAGMEPSRVKVQWEPEGVNLFLHITAG